MPELTATSEDTRVYEICVLIPHPLSQKEEEQIQKEVEKLLTEAGGIQMTKDIWGRRGLAYKIGGYMEGNYIVYHYELKPEKIVELDEHLRIVKGVLRHIIVKPPKGYQVTRYSEAFQQWQKERAQEEERSKLQKEEEYKKKLLERQKRLAKRTSAKKPTPQVEEREVAGGKEKMTEEIEKLISDDELGL